MALYIEFSNKSIVLQVSIFQNLNKTTITQKRSQVVNCIKIYMVCLFIYRFLYFTSKHSIETNYSHSELYYINCMYI